MFSITQESILFQIIIEMNIIKLITIKIPINKLIIILIDKFIKTTLNLDSGMYNSKIEFYIYSLNIFLKLK